MPNTYKLLLATFSALTVSTAALAQDQALALKPVSDVAASDIFTASDIDKDGALDRDEFVAYASAQSQAGDELYGSLILSGDFDNLFNTYDYNADGMLTPEEMKLPNADAISQDKAGEN